MPKGMPCGANNRDEVCRLMTKKDLKKTSGRTTGPQNHFSFHYCNGLLFEISLRKTGASLILVNPENH
jgi:hypothetical protein